MQLKFTCSGVAIAFDPADGSIVGLSEHATGTMWASATKRIAQMFSTADFDYFNRQHNPGCRPPCGAFAKAGMDIGVSGTHSPRLVSVRRAADTACSFLLALEFGGALHAGAGAPGSVEVNVTVTPEFDVDVEVVMLNKTATRLAEAMWLSVVPAPNTSPAEWAMDVLGSPVSPMEVVSNGTRHIHAVWGGVTWTGVALGRDGVPVRRRLHVDTLDVALLSPSDIDHLLRFEGDRQPSEFEGGMHFNLMNNLWGTAFPQSIGDDARFRFRLTVA